MIVHYNQMERTACYIPTNQVHVTNKRENVNCPKCKEFIKDKTHGTLPNM
jgi:hypothetical protein